MNRAGDAARWKSGRIGNGTIRFFGLDTLDFGPHREYSGLEKGYEL